MSGRRNRWDPRPTWCICSPEFYERRLLDPACRHDDLDEMQDTIDQLRADLAAAVAERDLNAGIAMRESAAAERLRMAARYGRE